MAAKKTPAKKSRFKSEAQKQRLRDKMAKGKTAAQKKRLREIFKGNLGTFPAVEPITPKQMSSGPSSTQLKAVKKASKVTSKMTKDAVKKVRAKSKTKTKPKTKARKVR